MKNPKILSLLKSFKFLTLCILLLQSISLAQSVDFRNKVAYEGQLTGLNGEIINLFNEGLTFSVKSSNNCYLYSEISFLAGDIFGNIYHVMGSGSVVSGYSTYTPQIFYQQTNGIDLNNDPCSASAAQERFIEVNVSSKSIKSEIAINSVPYALNSLTLQGKSASDFMPITSGTATLLSGGTSGQILTRTTTQNFAWVNLSQQITSATITDSLGYIPLSAPPSGSYIIKDDSGVVSTPLIFAGSNTYVGGNTFSGVSNFTNFVNFVSGTTFNGKAQFNSDVFVSGTIKFAGLPNVDSICLPSQEGSQRYSAAYKTMEYCDGQYWQGLQGVTHCATVTSGTVMTYKLVGQPGSPNAFCIHEADQTAQTYESAFLSCQNTNISKRTRGTICSDEQLGQFCSETASDLAMNNLEFVDKPLWTNTPSASNTQLAVKYSLKTGPSCDINSKESFSLLTTSIVQYRCCYK